MNAIPTLATLMHAIHREKLEVVLIGNAAAAMHGAPVTTLDFDFMFRDTPVNLRKLKRVADAIEATIMRPFYPVSKLYRMVDDGTGLQADFMPVIHGVKSFESLRSRALTLEIDGRKTLVAALDDIIKSKRAAGRDRDLAVLPLLERTAALVRRAPPPFLSPQQPGGARGNPKKKHR
jgi:hypothetical protein